MRILLVNMVVLFYSFSLAGQDSLPAKNKNTILKIDLLAPIEDLVNFNYRNVFSFSAEHSTFEDQSIQLTALYREYFIDEDFINYYIKDFAKTIQIFSQYRFYTTKRKRLYLGPYLTYSFTRQHGKLSDNISDSNSEWEFTQHDGGAGGVMGYQFFIKKRISVDFSLGVARMVVINKNIIKEDEPLHTAPKGAEGIAALNIGYRFIHKQK